MRLWQKIALLIPLAALVAPSGAGVSQASQDERLSIASLAGDGAVRLNGGDAYSVPEAAMSGVVKIVQSDARLYALKETGQLLVWTYPGGTLRTFEGPYQQISAQGSGALALRTNGVLEQFYENGYTYLSVATSVTGAAFGSPHYVYLKGNDVYDSRGGNVAPSNRSYQQVAAAGDSFAALGNGIVAAWTADAYLHRVDLPVPTAAQSGVSTVVGGGDTFAALKDGQAIAWRAVDGTRIDLAAAQNRELTELFVGGVQAPQCAVYGLRNGDQVVDLCTGQTQATGAYGIARAGNSTALLVKPGAPGPVRDLAAEPGSESIALRWRAPARDGNLPIAYYILRYRVVSPSPSPWSESEVDADAEEIRTSLDALGSDPVEVQVQAVNRRFAGETTTIASATVASPQVPRNVAVTAGRNAVAVTWDAPVSFGGAVADGYEVSASAGKGCGHVHDRRCRITGLADGQFVDVSVRAKNRVYSSAAVTASGAAEPLAGASLSLTNGESPVRQFKGETVPLAASYLWRYPSGSAPPPDGSPVRLQRRVGGSTWREMESSGRRLPPSPATGASL